MKNKKEILKKLDNLAQEKSNWQGEAEYRYENRSWLENSQMIALKILRCLRKNKMSQKELAEKLGVSPQQVNKWVKGGENFRLDTISKIEETISVYPNPASGHLIIETTGISGEVFINLVSSDGQNIYSAKTESGRNFQQKRITTKALKPGLYILKIQHYNGALIEKVIIRE